MTKRDGNNAAVFGAISGTLYILLGFLQVFAASGLDLGFHTILLIPEDLIGGLVLLVIGSVFLQGARRSKRSRNEGMSFILVASILGTFFMVVYTLILIADILEARVKAVGIEYSDTTLYDAMADVSFTPFPFLDIHGGYRIIDFDVDVDDVELKYTMSGPYAAVTVSF